MLTVRRQQHSFSTRTDVLVYVSKFLKQKTSWPERDSCPRENCQRLLNVVGINILEYHGRKQWIMLNTIPKIAPHIPISPYEILYGTKIIRANSEYGLSQWETALHYNVASHWLSPYTMIHSFMLGSCKNAWQNYVGNIAKRSHINHFALGEFIRVLIPKKSRWC